MNKVLCYLQVRPPGLLKPRALMKTVSRFKAHQDSLPRLPVPPLQQSLDHYLKALQPIVSQEEWAQTKQLVEEFQTSGGVGERLQKGLECRAKKSENWVSVEGTGTLNGVVEEMLKEGNSAGFLGPSWGRDRGSGSRGVWSLAPHLERSSPCCGWHMLTHLCLRGPALTWQRRGAKSTEAGYR